MRRPNSDPRTGSPSARRREEIAGLWNYDVDMNSTREVLLHWLKQIVGSPMVMLMSLLPIAFTWSRAATEIATWTLALLVCVYIGLDRAMKNREFNVFRVGLEWSLLALLVLQVLSLLLMPLASSNSEIAAQSTSFASLQDWSAGLGAIRWVPLVLIFSYAWDLFPGLNRVLQILVGAGISLVVVAIVQSLTGWDPLSIGAMESAWPASTGEASQVYVARGPLGSPEILGTMFAMLLALTTAAACLKGPRDERPWLTWVGFGLSLMFLLGLFLTFRIGLWWAGLTGTLSILLFPAERRFKLWTASIALLVGLWASLTWMASPAAPKSSGSPTPSVAESSGPANNEASADETLPSFARNLQFLLLRDASEREAQRQQMLKLEKIWESSPLIGRAGDLNQMFAQLEPVQVGPRRESSNAYFVLLSSTGLLGLLAYLTLIAHMLLKTLRLFQEIPASHHAHRVMVAGLFGAQASFHVAGLFWSTLHEATVMYMFALFLSVLIYMTQHYEHSLVSDDASL